MIGEKKNRFKRRLGLGLGLELVLGLGLGLWNCGIESKQSKAKMCNGRRHVPLCQACANKK